MMPVYEKIVGLTDDVCDRKLNSEYRDLARAMTAALCRKRPSPLASGQPQTWACGIVYVLGRINFLSDPSLSPHMTTAELCAAFEVGESTVHAKARVIERAREDQPAPEEAWRAHYLIERAGSNRLERWRLLLVLDGEIASRIIAAENDLFWSTMRNIMTQLLNEMPEQSEGRDIDQ
jgi:hypothetical protein